MSINPISHAEIMAWARLNRITPEPWEVSAVKSIDAAFMTVMLEDTKKKAKK